MNFWKMNGAGNDFILLTDMERRIPEAALPGLARTVCERRLSVGADGLMVLRPALQGGDFRMLFFNSDGSVGEMCGNGARCVCRYGYETGLAGREAQRVETGAGRCALASTGGFTPAAVRAAEWVDPPVRLIAGRQLALLAGQQHPASDEEIARYVRRRRTPFSWRRIRALALSPAKLPRYLLCAFLLLMAYFFSGSPALLAPCLLSYVLALLCDRENRRRFFL